MSHTPPPNKKTTKLLCFFAYVIISACAAPPDPPYNLSIVSCGGSDADLEWEFREEQSNFSPLQEFVMEYNTTHDPKVWIEAKRVAADRR